MFKWILLIIIVLNQLLISTISLNPTHPEKSDPPLFPLIQQPDGITCGPTSVAMLLNYYGKNVNVKEIKAQTKTHWLNYKNVEIGMTLPVYIEHVLKDFGIPSKIEFGTIHKLKRYVSKGQYPIALVRSGLKTWHYVVVIGYNQDNIIIADPGWGEVRSIPMKIFNNSWGFLGNLAGEHYGSDFYGNLLKKTDIVSDHVFVVPL